MLEMGLETEAKTQSEKGEYSAKTQWTIRHTKSEKLWDVRYAQSEKWWDVWHSYGGHLPVMPFGYIHPPWSSYATEHLTFSLWSFAYG